MTQSEEWSVQQALERGRRQLSYPASIGSKLIAGILILLIFLNILPIGLGLLLIPVGMFGFIWVYRSRMTTKWKLWAFENVRNVHEQKAKALMEGLISERSGFLEKALRTPAENRRLAELRKKFEVPDVFSDHPAVAEETCIYFPQYIYRGWVIFLSIGIAITPVYFAMTGKRLVLFLLPPALYFLWVNGRKLYKPVPEIVLNQKGIETIDSGFVSWDLIENETILKEDNDGISYYLFFRHPGGAEKVCIDKLPVEPGELYDLLKIYRGRSKKD